jgi:hypothetical protein
MAKANTNSDALKNIKPVQIQTKDQRLPQPRLEAAKPKLEPASTTTGDSKSWASFTELRRKYRNGEISDREAWDSVAKISTDLRRLTKSQQAAILQTHATLLLKAKQPILASLYAAQALRESPEPLTEEYKRSWQILREVSKDHPLQNLLEAVATSVNAQDKPIPIFGSDWNFFVGNALTKINRSEQALAAYQKLSATDRYYFPARFQEAMLHLDSGNKSAAINSLRTIVLSANNASPKISQDELLKLRDQAHIALARIYYEDRKFSDSIRHYRLVRRDGAQFYDSLFEQSWALFLAGYPNHALGMLHGVRSPFFKETFNPEGTMLASIIYYWMCRYDDSRAELAEFITKHQKSTESLDRYLKKGITNPKTYYQLFENTVTGVSSESLDLPREILNMAVQQDNLLYARDQFASVIGESQKLDTKGIFGSKKQIEGPRNLLDKWISVIKDDIGTRLRQELMAMKQDYERLHDQGQFLYIELLMSKKDQLLGKELHSSTKITRVSQTDNIKGWARKTQSWANDDKNEFWSDELGFHIYKLEPMCAQSH